MAIIACAPVSVLAACTPTQPEVALIFDRYVCELGCIGRQTLHVPQDPWLELIAGPDHERTFSWDEMTLHTATSDEWVISELRQVDFRARAEDPWCYLANTDEMLAYPPCEDPLPDWPPDDCWH